MYYPILRWKKGEQLAVSNLASDELVHVKPIWWITAPDDVVNLASQLKDVWTYSSIVDLSRIKLSDPLLPTIEELGSSMGVNIMLSPDQLPHIDEALPDMKSKVCVRIDLSNPSPGLVQSEHKDIIGHLATFWTLDLRDLVILFDCGPVARYDINFVTQIMQCISIYKSAGYSNFIFGSGAFPESLAGIVGIIHLNRYDKELYIDVKDALQCDISYSDYGAFSPAWVLQSGGGAPLANVRYTISDKWMIIRDEGKGTAASCAVAAILVMSNEFALYGEDFSWADKRWQFKVDTNTKPGGPTQHIAEAHNHHITHVVNRD
jgi:hypothetical protein